MSDGTVQSWPRILLRAEGAAIFTSTIWAYWRTGLSWWLFAGGILLPDLGMAGFLANNVAGAATYNTLHTETPPILLLCTGFARGDARLTGAALIWLAHIGMDRMFGFGLKYGTRFGHTHLGIIA
ncbi:Uu.00g033240.m01.CDS01 [Anthostomella pinea]|uniref:Uu.00g033240.m01.CDS01 n=1 Tax=Anthostomella pinea TaxID=933095 RepID=A0AAI8V9U8_9PEZI|nr:Uu.00g033240.m01.CDS01 [Anthostomella pinea]